MFQARLDAYEVETRRLKEAAEAQEKQVKEAGQTAEELRLQVRSLHCVALRCFTASVVYGHVFSTKIYNFLNPTPTLTLTLP